MTLKLWHITLKYNCIYSYKYISIENNISQYDCFYYCINAALGSRDVWKTRAEQHCSRVCNLYIKHCVMLLIKSPAKWCFLYTPKPLFTFIWHLMIINFGPRSQVYIPGVRQIYECLSVPGPLSFHPSPSIPPSLTENLYTELRSHSAK